MDKSHYAIWWTDQKDCESICLFFTVLKSPLFPKYIVRLIRDRYGRPGRGRLWADGGFPELSVDPWPVTPLAVRLGEDYGGIVIYRKDAVLFQELPGILTDFNLRRI